MREDVRVNNKIKVFATTPDSFGSNPNIDYSQHPLLQDSGLTDINGQTLIALPFILFHSHIQAA